MPDMTFLEWFIAAPLIAAFLVFCVFLPLAWFFRALACLLTLLPPLITALMVPVCLLRMIFSPAYRQSINVSSHTFAPSSHQSASP
ncbi:MAG: hypothetical protein LBC94_02765 [Desulfovibrio sp.]|jgi:hypothetical protein|nr:hypothetical protein [Desulfovibrio sp.]